VESLTSSTQVRGAITASASSRLLRSSGRKIEI